jgi:exonuclease III
MIMRSFNVRGLGSRVKRAKIHDVVCSEHVDFLAIQETKMEVISNSLISNIWGSGDFDWCCLPAVGNSGDILSIWNKLKASLVFTFIRDGFVGVCLHLLAEDRKCFVVNVYAKCNLRDKRSLWNNIIMSKEGF